MQILEKFLLQQVASSHKIQRVSKTPMLGFTETAVKVFEYGSPWAKRYSNQVKIFVDYGMMIMYFSIGSVFIVFTANTFHAILNDLLGWNYSVRIYILATLIPVFFIGQIRSLKLLVPFSGVSNTLIVITFVIVLYYIFNDKLLIEDKPFITSFTTWPMFFR